MRGVIFFKQKWNLNEVKMFVLIAVKKFEVIKPI